MGTQVNYVACNMCGKTIVQNKFSPEPFTIDPSEFIILQVREQRGGSSKQEGSQPGFFLQADQSKTMKQLWESSDPSEKLLAETFKERILSVVKAYFKDEIIQPNDLKEVLKGARAK